MFTHIFFNLRCNVIGSCLMFVITYIILDHSWTFLIRLSYFSKGLCRMLVKRYIHQQTIPILKERYLLEKRLKYVIELQNITHGVRPPYIMFFIFVPHKKKLKRLAFHVSGVPRLSRRLKM